MERRRALAVLLLAASLQGCATSPISAEDASAVPVAEEFAKPIAGGGMLIVTRDSGFMGAGCSIHLFLNGIDAAKLGTSDKATLYLPAGDYTITAQPGGICGGGTAEADFTIKPMATKRFRVGSGQSGDLHIGPTGL